MMVSHVTTKCVRVICESGKCECVLCEGVSVIC